MIGHLWDVLVLAIVLAALVIVIAVRGVEAAVRSAVPAVPVSWLLCDEQPASGGAGRDGEPRELTDDACELLSRWSTPWADEDADDE